MSAYNGWTNWETWNVALWIDNEEGPYHDRRLRYHSLANGWSADEVKSFALEYFPGGTPDFDAFPQKELAAVNWKEIADNWNEEHEEENE